jgi:glycosyltransferase involved in cell wall biosynthesis
VRRTEGEHFGGAAGGRRIIVHTPEPGAGAGQYVTEFVKGLAGKGETVKLFCPANFSYEQDLAGSGVEIIRAPLRRVGFASLPDRVLRNMAFALGALKKFWPVVRRRDIVHFQFALHLGLGLLFFLVARAKGAFVVLTVHDPLPHRWILPGYLRWLETGILSAGYALCHKLIVHNQTGQQVLVKHFRLDAKDVSVIPHGPLHMVSAAPKNIESGHQSLKPLRLLAFGSLRENKGLHLTIAAIQRLRRTDGGRPVWLTIAGRTPNLMEKPYWEGCKRLIAAEPDAIEVIERLIGDEEIVPLFARHDAALLPYLEFFSDSGVAMLALSQGKPVIATAAGGLGELLEHTDCGIRIESPTVDGVASSISKARLAPAEWLETKGLNGYLYVANERSWSAIAQKTQKVYEEILQSGPRVVLHTPEPASSAALYVEALSKALACEGVPVTVVCPANHMAIPSLQREPAVKVRTCRARGTRTDVSILTKVWDNLRFIVSSGAILMSAAKTGDIVHLQYILHLPFGLVFFLCAWLKRAHIVFTVHDPLPHKFLFPRHWRGVEMRSLRWAYQWSDVLIAHSEAGKRTLVEQFQLPADKIRVIVHGPYQLNKALRPCSETDRLEVLFFGSLRENKAPHLAIQAVRQLAVEGVPIRLTVAGQVVNRKEERYWEGCRKLIDNQSPAIRLLERFVPDEQLPELFSKCHCFVLPYTNFSSDSGVAYMAMANGKPIISTGAGGLGWLLNQSHGGIEIAEASVESVASALRLAADLGPAQLERMGRTGAEWVLTNCGWPKVARETRAVYARWISELWISELSTDLTAVKAAPDLATPAEAVQ